MMNTEYQRVLDLFEQWRAFEAPVYTDGVPDYSPAGMQAKLERLPEFRALADAIDTDALTLPERVDLESIRCEMNGMEYYITTLRPYFRDPSFYRLLRDDDTDVPDWEVSIVDDVFQPAKYEHPLSPEAREDFVRRMGAIPGTLAQARENLTEDGKTLWEYGVLTADRQAGHLAEYAEKFAEVDPSLVAITQAAADAAKEFAAWVTCRTEAMDDAPCGLTMAEYNAAMKQVHRVPYDWKQQEDILQRELNRAWTSLKLEQHRNRHLPPLEFPKSVEEMADRVREAYPQFMDYIREQEIFTVDEYMSLTREPGDSLPDFDTLDFFCHIEFRHLGPLRCHMIHYLDLQREAHETHPIRRHTPRYKTWAMRCEGLATAFEEIMMQTGFLDDVPRARELVYALIAFRAARGLGGLRYHGLGWSLQQAIDFSVKYTPNGWLDADGELIRGDMEMYVRQPIYGPSYLVGKIQLEQLMADRAEQLGDDFVLRDFMDDYFRRGLIPASLIRWEMTGLRDEMEKVGVLEG